MNRIDQAFARLRAEGRKGLVGYLTAGDPTMAASERHLRAAIQAGVDVLEIGVPFSDPTADGPVIQAASQRSLAHGFDLLRILGLVRRLRRDCNTPIVLFGYANPFYRYGFSRLAREAAEAGVDGILVVDMPNEEADEFRDAARGAGICWIPLIAPTTPLARARRILRKAEGFVYYIMVTGVTGERAGIPADVARHVNALRRVTRLPIAVGFGVASGVQARVAAQKADAVGVGSALVRAAQQGRLRKLVTEIRSALDR